MRHFLVCRFNKSPSSRISWAIIDTLGNILDNATDVLPDTLPRQYTDLIVFIPGTDVTLTQVSIPSKRRQRIIQAIPFTLEEFLAEEVEKLHFALGNPDKKTGKIPVAVIARAQMDAYLHSLQAIGLKPKKLIPDFLLIPKPNNGWGISYLGELALVRIEQYKGFTVEIADLEKLLSIALNEPESRPPQQLQVVTQNQTPENLISLHALGIPVVEQTEKHPFFASLTSSLLDSSLNLLQGDYRSLDKTSNFWRSLRLTIGLAIIFIVLTLAIPIVEYYQLTEQRKELTEKIETLYRETFPEARKIVNPRAQMDYQLQQLRAQHASPAQQENFLVSFAQFSVLLSQTEGLNLKRVDYHDHQFDIELEAAHLQALEQLRLAVNQLGFTTEILSATSHNNRVESNVRIKINR